VALLAAVAIAATAAGAPDAIDHEHGVHFVVDGPVLTVSLLPGATVRDRVWDKPVRAVCSPSWRGRGSVTEVQTWPAGRAKLAYTFEHDIAERVKTCLLEDPDRGRDIAGVQFSTPPIPVHGTSAKDRRIGRKLRRYLWRNVGSEPWLERVTGIVVDDEVIAVTTQLRRNRRGKQVSRWLCQLIQGADVADFTPGHTIFGRGDAVVRACPARRE
jgi:hypothetical protein